MLKGRLLKIILSCLLLCLVLGNILLVLGNQSLQAEVGDRQQIIAQAIQLDTLSRQVVGVLANMALKNNDQQLKKLLQASGVDIDGPAAPAGGAK